MKVKQKVPTLTEKSFIIICVGGLALLLLLLLVSRLSDFQRALNHVTMEIRRTTGSEQKYWKRERRRLWLSLLLFFPY